jgi:hypothetical protein
VFGDDQMSDDLDEKFDEAESDEFEDKPLPAEFNFVDTAAREVVRPEWIGHPPWKAARIFAAGNAPTARASNGSS